MLSAGVGPADMNWFVPGQANIRMIEAGVKRSGCDPERVLVSLDKLGNTSAGQS